MLDCRCCQEHCLRPGWGFFCWENSAAALYTARYIAAFVKWKIWPQRKPWAWASSLLAYGSHRWAAGCSKVCRVFLAWSFIHSRLISKVQTASWELRSVPFLRWVPWLNATASLSLVVPDVPSHELSAAGMCSAPLLDRSPRKIRLYGQKCQFCGFQVTQSDRGDAQRPAAVAVVLFLGRCCRWSTWDPQPCCEKWGISRYWSACVHGWDFSWLLFQVLLPLFWVVSVPWLPFCRAVMLAFSCFTELLVG